MFVKKYKQFINEKMGVPDGIIESGEKLHQYIIDILSKNPEEEMLRYAHEQIKMSLGKINIKIDDMSFDINLSLAPEVVGMGGSWFFNGAVVSIPSTSTSPGAYLYEYDNKKLEYDITIRLGAGLYTQSITANMVIEFMTKHKSKFTSTLSHELKHLYDLFKRGKVSIKKLGEYSLRGLERYSNVAKIPTIRAYLHKLYYTNEAEGLVRTTEISSMIKSDKITKPEFYAYLTGTQIYKELVACRDYTFDQFKTDLMKDDYHMGMVLDEYNIEYDKEDKEDMVSHILEILSDAVKNKLDTAHIDLSIITKLSNKDGGIIDRKHKSNFIERSFKTINGNANKIINKISKLYDLCEDVEKIKLK